MGNERTIYSSSMEPEEYENKIKELKSKLKSLELENIKLRSILKENDLDDSDINMSDEEAICFNEIKKLKDISDAAGLTLEDVKILDILHKNLLMARGRSTKEVKPKGSKTTAELLSIVEGIK